MANLALLDLVLPYVLRGENIGPTHAALSALRVVTYEQAADDLGVTLRGHCEVNGSLDFFPSSGTLVAGGVDEATPAHDPSRSDPIFDLRDTTVDFELFVPRQGSAIVAAAQATFSAAALPTGQVFTDWGGATPSDYPSTGFTFDLILNAPRLRPPFLHPARLGPIGVLEPDPTARDVAIVLPRLRFRLAHGNPLNSQLVFSFQSAGVADLDDPGSTEVSQFITMEPPYAYIGSANDRAVGIGFRSATLDLDADWTPPALRDKAGVGDDWTGLYLPEARVFVAPDGLRNLAFECGAQELLIGVDRTGGIWGDFDAALVQQGSGELRITPRFDTPGRSYGIVRGAVAAGVQQATAQVPETSTLVVEVSGGRTPYTREVTVNGVLQTPPARTYQVTLPASGTATIDIHVRSGATSGTPAEARMHIEATRLNTVVRVLTPGSSSSSDQPATITAETGFDFDIVNGAGTGISLTTNPARSGLQWREGATLLATAPTLSTALGGPETKTFTVTLPGLSGTSTLDYYFFYDCPGGGGSSEVRTAKAVDKLHQVWTGGSDPMTAYAGQLDALATNTMLTISGDASYENDPNRLDYNTKLAYRRAAHVQSLITAAYPGKFRFTLKPTLADPTHPTPAEENAWASDVGWTGHVAPHDNEHWLARVSAAATTANTTGAVTVDRPAPTTTTTPAVTETVDPPPPETSPPPDWFRSARVKVRVVRSQLIALQMDLEVDINTVAEQRLSGNMSGAPAGTAPPNGRSIANGTPTDNAADGITAFRVLVQTDPATGRWDTLLTAGADPADTDGLFHFGWIAGTETMPASKDLGLTFLGSYLSFWPLLAAAPPVDAARNVAEGRDGAVVDAVLSGAALVAPGVVALLPWFSVERVILYGVEYFHTQRDGGFTGTLLADVEADWSVNLLDIVKIKREQPLKVRYKAIGLRLTNRDAEPPIPAGSPDPTRWDFLPVFDASRGYTIDVASGGGMTIADPLGQILRIAGARLSRSNPMTLDVDIAMGVDLGVVSIDQASIRAYLDTTPMRPPELTALSAGVDIPGALVGSGYMRIATLSDGTQTIGGQIDLTLRPISLRITAAVEIATIHDGAREATGVYIGLNIVLPAGIPLGSTGLGIFGFRGIFGMHYRRTEFTGPAVSAPTLEWLKRSQGKPHLLKVPGTGDVLWEPKIDNWAFGIGILIGTMEGGVLINLDGTFLLELPGPRVLIMMNARILVPPPSVDGLGQSGGVLAVIEITPEHFLIGVIVQWEIEDLIKIVIPIEAVFPFPPHMDEWHIYLGARRDVGASVEVDVLGIVRGSGYLMFKGDGLNAFNTGHATLPEIRGFAVGLGVAASFTWGDVDDGLYLTIGGGMDAVLGFDPFLLAGNIWVAGELRLWVISIGADASLDVKVAEIPGPPGPDGEPTSELSLYVHGRACGHVDLFFFEVSGCVEITISGPEHSPPIPTLVEKVSLQARSPGLAQGTAVDRSPDTSLGEAPSGTSYPGDGNVPVVPIDAIPVISMIAPASPDGAVTLAGMGVLTPGPGVDPSGYATRSSEKYRYRIKALKLERVKGNGQVDAQTYAPGSVQIPPVWWSTAPADEANAVAQLALLTWQATPATKAIEFTDKLVQDVKHRWGTACSSAAEPAEVLWTFKLEPLGPSQTGWDLEGVAWPDLPGTRRSQAPETHLRVTEPWRSGNAQLDALRGVVPALVIGGVVECHRKRPSRDLGGLVVNGGRLDVAGLRERVADLPPVVRGGVGPVVAGRMSGELLPHDDGVRALVTPVADSMAVRVSADFHAKATEALAGLNDLTARAHTRPELSDLLADAADVPPLRRVETDLVVQRLLDLDRLTAGRATVDAPEREQTPGSRCPVKVLQAPLRDRGELTNLPDPALAKQLKAAKVPTHEGSDLVDLVHLHTGPFREAGILLLLPPYQRKKFVAVAARVLDDKGNELKRVDVTPSDVLGSGATLPGHWTDLSGPWGNDVDDLVRWAADRKMSVAYLQLPDEYDDAALIELGRPRNDDERESALAVYYLAAFGMVSGAEVTRSDWDTLQIANDRTRLTKAVGPDSTTNALLMPDSRYRVVVDWYADRLGDGETEGSAGTPISQTFWFRTDKIVAGPTDPMLDGALVFNDTPAPTPVRLDPWVMLTMPEDNEIDWFGKEHLRLVFNTHDLDRMFAAHGKELRLRIEAANGEHPGGTPAAPLPLTITGPALTPVKTLLTSPWDKAFDAAVAELGAESPDGTAFCVERDQNLHTHSEVELDIPLAPFMGYLLDVECVPAGSPASTRGPRVFRRHLTTGGFGTLEAFAWSVSSCLPASRSATAGTFAGLWTTLGAHPQGAQVDGYLLSRGLEALPAPDQPRVVVFWEQSGSALPQPAAVMIDATEPLSRSRAYPKEITDATVRDHPQRWVMADREWLHVETGGDAGIVRGITYAPGSQRVFVVLNDGARGKHLTVDLVAPAMPDLPFLDAGVRRAALTDLNLAHAPWEEV